MRRRNSAPTLGDFSLQFRQAWEDLRDQGYRQEYYLHKNARFRPSPPGVAPLGSGADFHLSDENAALRGIERAEHFNRNNAIVGPAVQRLVDNVLSDLPTVQPLTGDNGLNMDLAQEFYAWGESAEACDDALEDDLFSLAHLTFKSMIVGGDAITVLNDEGRLQTFEAYRCRTPKNTNKNVIRGVMVDERRRRLEYWLTKEELSPRTPLARVGDVYQVRTRDAEGERQVLHTLDKRRVSQTRGVSAFAPCVDMVGMHDDLQFAALVKAQMAACWAILEELAPEQVGTPPVPGLNDDAKSATGPRTTDEEDREEEEIRPGMRIRGRPGVKHTGFTPNIPNQEFFPHVKLILTFISINLNIPVQALLLSPESNFSAWRGAMDEGRKGFRRLQRLMISRFFAPLYRFHLRRRIATDATLQRFAEKNVDFFKVDFLPPAWRYIEPNKDAQGDAVRKRYMLDSPRRIAAERQLDYPELVRETMEDIELAIDSACKHALNVRKKYPMFVIDWRDFYQPPTVDQVAGKSSDPAGNQPAAPAADEGADNEE